MSPFSNHLKFQHHLVNLLRGVALRLAAKIILSFPIHSLIPSLPFQGRIIPFYSPTIPRFICFWGIRNHGTAWFFNILVLFPSAQSIVVATFNFIKRGQANADNVGKGFFEVFDCDVRRIWMDSAT